MPLYPNWAESGEEQRRSNAQLARLCVQDAGPDLPCCDLHSLSPMNRSFALHLTVFSLLYHVELNFERTRGV